MKRLIAILVLWEVWLTTKCPSGLGPESILGAKALLAGSVPYQDFHMHICPLTMLMYAALLSVPALVWYSLLFSAFNLLTAWGVYRIGRLYWDWTGAAFAACLFLMVAPLFDANAIYVETIMMAFGVWAVYFAHRERYWLMSLMVVLAILTKQTGIIYAAALFPFVGARGRRVMAVSIGTVALASVGFLHHYGVLGAFIHECGPQAFSHAIFDPVARMRTWGAALILCPSLILLALFARKVPRIWLVVVALFVVQNLMAPQLHYMLPAIPFLCLIAMRAFNDPETSKWGIIGFMILLPFTIARDLGAFVSPFKHRPYSVLNASYQAGVLKNVKEPLWTNWPVIYLLRGEPLFGSDYMQTIQWRTIDWTKEPYRSVNTRAYFYDGVAPEEIVDPPGWTHRDVPLTQGQFTTVRIMEKSND